MPSDEYWNSDPFRIRAYVEAAKLRNQKINEEMWLHGVYIMEAISTVFSDKKNKHRYPKEPFDLYPKPKDPDEERRKIIEHFTALKARWDKAHGRSSTQSKN